ncbi:hypothetical protein TNCV_4904961 [Trichonephila clavipes]|uniref:Uncharacterized protein n=1 Tax=Trichonephila clavipes TaxID=2585209 RepID=A0A8X6RWR1_TRICX|nr:hypothetical protein TNCV_4904961 [Trichonephila clavipes]
MSLVYADKPQIIDRLKDNIRRVIADIRPQMLEKVIENWTSRLDYIRASRGRPMPEIIFKMGRIIGLREAGWSNGRIGRHLGRSDMVLLGVGNSGSQKVECTVAEGQDVPGTQMIARGSCNQKSGHFGTNNVASIDSTPLTSFQTSSAIKRNHKRRLTEVGLRSRRPLRHLPLTPHHRQCRLDFCRPRQLECDRLETCHLQ